MTHAIHIACAIILIGALGNLAIDGRRARARFLSLRAEIIALTDRTANRP